jgi:hypothetical protein
VECLTAANFTGERTSKSTGSQRVSDKRPAGMNSEHRQDTPQGVDTKLGAAGIDITPQSRTNASDLSEGEARKEGNREPSCDTDTSNDQSPIELSENNVENLVIPVLCNMAACCMQLKEWAKAAMFCDQALQLRPQCIKALMRKG